MTRSHGSGFLFCAAWLACLIILPSLVRAVTYLPELDPERLAELARQPQFASVCQVNSATGVLIAPSAVLTARHVLFTDGRHQNRVFVAGVEREVSRIVPHRKADLALLLLRTPVEDVAPTPIYRGQDETGRLVWKVGFGVWAPLVEGHEKMLQHSLGIARAVTNDVSEVSTHELYYRADHHGSSRTIYEGGTAPGDSGAPLYGEVDGTFYVMGVTSGARTRTVAPDVHDGFYVDARVSPHAGWIDQVVNGRPFSTGFTLLSIGFFVFTSGFWIWMLGDVLRKSGHDQARKGS